MKTPLRYQLTEYDCGPTSVLNAISFLFDREDIPPEIIKNITLFTLDRYGSNGERCMGGTSRMAMMYLSEWLNAYGGTGLLPVSGEYYSGENVFLGGESAISDAVKNGAVAVIRLYFDVWHYVLVTGERDGKVFLFDPYYADKPFKEEDVILDDGHPFEYNRIVPLKYFDCEKIELYALGEKAKREALVIRRTDKK